MYTPFDPAILLLSIYTTEVKALIHSATLIGNNNLNVSHPGDAVYIGAFCRRTEKGKGGKNSYKNIDNYSLIWK